LDGRELLEVAQAFAAAGGEGDGDDEGFELLA
jgi:hypothetical protein